MHPHNATRMVEVMREFGFDVKGLSEELFLEANNVVRLGVPPLRIEVLTTISGVDFEECYRARNHDSIDGIEVQLISLEHLKANKKASGRLKDLSDLEHLP